MNNFFVVIAILQFHCFVSAKAGAFHHTDFQDRVYPAPIPADYVETFRKFSLKSVLAPSFNIDQPDLQNDRAIQSSPGTLAYLLSVVNDKGFGIETRDLTQALEVPQDQVSRVYSAVVDNLMQDREMTLTSAVFTKYDNFSATSLSDLHSYIQVLNPLVENDKAVEAINNYVSNHTGNLITDQLLPADSPFYNSTISVVVNTAYIQNTFKKPMTPIGKKEFRVSKDVTQFVDTLEMINSNLPVYHADQYTAVHLKMKKKKSLVLIKPKESLGNFMKNDIKDIFSVDFLNKFVVQTQEIRVQVPVLNLTLARTFTSEYETPLKIPSFTSAICDSSTDKENLLQKIVQITTVRLSSSSLQVATAVGVSIENVKDYRKEFGADGVNTTNPDDPLAGGKLHKIIQKENIASDASDPEPEAEAEPEPSIARSIVPDDHINIRQAPSAIAEKYVPVHIQVQPMMLSRADNDPSGQMATQDSQGTDVIFDSPYFVYLYDEVLGPFEFLAVRSPIVLDSTANVPVESEDFSAYKKLSRWVCIAPPPPLLPKNN